MQLPDTQVKSEFLTIFGRPARNVCDYVERSVDATIAQALHVINGDTFNKKLSAPDGYVALFLKLGLSDARILDHVFLTAFSRYPSDAETRSACCPNKAAERRDAPRPCQSRRQSLEDVLWALVNEQGVPIQSLGLVQGIVAQTLSLPRRHSCRRTVLVFLACVVIGNGNVAVDVARMLALTSEELAPTDTADDAIAAIVAAGVEEIVVLGRRGPVRPPSRHRSCRS